MGLIAQFIAGTTARAAAEIIGVQLNTLASFFMFFRRLITSKLSCYELDGEVEADSRFPQHAHQPLPVIHRQAKPDNFYYFLKHFNGGNHKMLLSHVKHRYAEAKH